MALLEINPPMTREGSDSGYGCALGAESRHCDDAKVEPAKVIAPFGSLAGALGVEEGKFLLPRALRPAFG